MLVISCQNFNLLNVSKFRPGMPLGYFFAQGLFFSFCIYVVIRIYNACAFFCSFKQSTIFIDIILNVLPEMQLYDRHLVNVEYKIICTHALLKQRHVCLNALVCENSRSA